MAIANGLLRHIQDCTLEYARAFEPDFSLELSDIEAFIWLMYLKDAMNNKNFPYDLHWSDDLGCELFKKTMPRSRFRATGPHDVRVCQRVNMP
jgi:hypothetical protein